MRQEKEKQLLMLVLEYVCLLLALHYTNAKKIFVDEFLQVFEV